jgi:hypothetical protein
VVPGARIGEAMSRNRSSTACECGLWSFRTEAVVPAVDPLLLTESAYFDAAGFPLDHRWRRGNVWMRDGVQVGDPFWGYGYREDLAGPWYMYRVPGDPSGGSSSHHRHPYTERVLIAMYDSVPPEDRYRFRKLQCVFCRRLYAGYYLRQPQQIDRERTYELYDTSFFHAFNDEPSDEDLREMREWTPEKLAALAARWNLEER